MKNWNIKPITTAGSSPSPDIWDHIQMPFCDLLWLNTIIGLHTDTRKRNLVCCIRDISRSHSKKKKKWSWAARLQPQWLWISGEWCNLRRKLWQPSSSQAGNGAQCRDTWANTWSCWEEYVSCLCLSGSQCHTYIASGGKVVLRGCDTHMYLVIGFFRRVFKLS